MLPDVPEYILHHVVMPYLHVRPYAFCFASLPALIIVPPGPCPALHDQAESTTPVRAESATAPPVRDECIRAPLLSLPGFYPLPDRRPPHSPRLRQSVHRRRHEPRLH